MGVIKPNKDSSITGREEEQSENYIENQSDVPSMTQGSPLPNRKRRSAPAKKWFAEFRKWDNISDIKKAAGVRRIRRSENLNFLLNMAEQDEFGENDFPDINEPQFSAFAELFREHEKMKIWNDFIGSSEDEQQRFLSSEHNTGPDLETDDDVEMIGANDSWEKLDIREVHPAYSAEECFKRINQSLKSLLKKKHLPLGQLCHLEEEITGFFNQWPSSVYLSQLQSGYDRMLVHSVCQYLDLNSHSRPIGKIFVFMDRLGHGLTGFDDDQGVRQTQVENQHEFFLPPDISLSQFIEAKSNKHKQ